MSPDEPYGAVEYGDPGYLPDGKARYPLDSEQHCRSAWSFINQADNADKYTPAQLKRIKARIQAAGKKYGIEFADRVEAAKDMLGVEIARTGHFKLKTGQIQVTARMLDDAARFANRPGARPGHLKIGHTDTRFRPGDGEPALGWVKNQRVEVDENGEHVLKADLIGMPEWLAEAAPSAWPYRSMEGYQGYLHDGEEYGLVVEGLALLGLEPPGMSTLADLPQALGVAASSGLEPSGTRIVASFGEQTPASAEVTPTNTGGMSIVDKAKIREALGLDPDASDEQVREAFSAEIPLPAPVAASAQPGTIVLASSVWDETQQTIKTLNKFVEETKRNERDEIVAQAVKVGKFTPAQKPQFVAMWDSNPDATRNLIASLTPNSAIAVMASGHAGDLETEAEDAEFAHLFPPKEA